MKQLSNWSSKLLWIIYLALLAVLLPHTAWAFNRFEPQTDGWLSIPWGTATAWAAAFAFEAAIAALTHRLAHHIEATPHYTDDRVALRRFSYQYLNAYAAGLFVALGVSALANFAHAVEYGQEFAIFRHYDVPPLLYSVTFGGILPLVSLLFARILGDTAATEAAVDPRTGRAPDGTFMAVVTDRAETLIRDLVAGRERFVGRGSPFQQVTNAVFSLDGTQLATASQNGAAQIWDPHTGEPLLTLTGHTNQVNSVAYSDDGTRLATASTEWTTRVWDAGTGELLLTISTHPVGVWRAVFSHDGTRLITAIYDNTIRVHVPPIEELMDLARSRLTRSLTEEEGLQYLHLEQCSPAPQPSRVRV